VDKLNQISSGTGDDDDDDDGDEDYDEDEGDEANLYESPLEEIDEILYLE
jgi:hypothetical protein